MQDRLQSRCSANADALTVAALSGSRSRFGDGRAINGAGLSHSVHSCSLAGGLASYGGDTIDSYRLTGVYVARVLKGEKTADLPVQQGTKLQLFINAKATGALGIVVPLPLPGRADEVIE